MYDRDSSATFGDRLTIQERFELFDREHPEVYDMLVRLASDLKRRGFVRYGLKSLFERVRWHFQVDRNLGDDFKLNNIFTSRYARKIIGEHPEFEGFFQLRELKAE